ncbi:MAG: TatD family hydrolase [bacterium]
MIIVEPHIHMLSRTTDDYQAMYDAGIRCCVEPAFWLGTPRHYPGTFYDYYELILDYETVRGERYGVDHWACVSVNPKEADNAELASETLAGIERFFDHPRCICVGEIGFNNITRNEEDAFVRQLHMAEERQLPVMIHTPHRDKRKGVERIVEIIQAEGMTLPRIDVDHNTEDTMDLVAPLDCWAGLTVYPYSKLDPQRVVNILQEYGTDRVMVNSSADWGVSDPTALRKVADNMAAAGFDDEEIEKLLHDNPLGFYGQTPKFQPRLDLEPLPPESFQR